MPSRPRRQARLRRWIRRTSGALLLLIAALPIAASAQERQLELGSTPWSPFTNAQGEPRFALDLVEEALIRIGVFANIVIVAEGTLTPLLLSGEFDGSAALWRDTERERVLLYSQPYLENRLILVGRHGSDVSASTLDDLAGKRVALVAGYAYGESVEAAVGPIFVDSHSPEDSVAKLLNGEADYTLMDELVVQHLVNNHAEDARSQLAFGATPMSTRSLHLAIRRSLPEAHSIISRFNTEVADMIVDGTYHRLLRIHWIFADIDGDGLREHVPHDDRAGLLPPERSYLLFAEDSPTTEPGTTRRYYFGGNVYDDWSTVPARHKSPDFIRPVEGLRIFTFRF